MIYQQIKTDVHKFLLTIGNNGSPFHQIFLLGLHSA